MNEPVPSVDVDGLAAALESGAALIDVREPHEHAEVRVPGATLIPLGSIPDRVAELPGGPFYVICASGGRSMRAAGWLRSQGLEAINVAGGTGAWVGSGRATSSGVE